jgi:hypothetical protein
VPDGISGGTLPANSCLGSSVAFPTSSRNDGGGACQVAGPAEGELVVRILDIDQLDSHPFTRAVGDQRAEGAQEVTVRHDDQVGPVGRILQVRRVVLEDGAAGKGAPGPRQKPAAAAEGVGECDRIVSGRAGDLHAAEEDRCCGIGDVVDDDVGGREAGNLVGDRRGEVHRERQLVVHGLKQAQIIELDPVEEYLVEARTAEPQSHRVGRHQIRRHRVDLVGDVGAGPDLIVHQGVPIEVQVGRVGGAGQVINPGPQVHGGRSRIEAGQRDQIRRLPENRIRKVAEAGGRLDDAGPREVIPFPVGGGGEQHLVNLEALGVQTRDWRGAPRRRRRTGRHGDPGGLVECDPVDVGLGLGVAGDPDAVELRPVARPEQAVAPVDNPHRQIDTACPQRDAADRGSGGVDAGCDQVGVGDRPDPFPLNRDLGSQRISSGGSAGRLDVC